MKKSLLTIMFIVVFALSACTDNNRKATSEDQRNIARKLVSNRASIKG